MNTVTGTGGGGSWTVSFDGKPLSPARSQRVQNYSPDGFAWGYHGSGPAQLALAILLEAGLSDKDAVKYHQEFKREFIAKQLQEFTLQVDVLAWFYARETRV